jgi:hypothetical protein
LADWFAGKILAKAGFFALILKNIKLIGLAIVAFWRGYLAVYYGSKEEGRGVCIRIATCT